MPYFNSIISSLMARSKINILEFYSKVLEKHSATNVSEEINKVWIKAISNQLFIPIIWKLRNYLLHLKFHFKIKFSCFLLTILILMKTYYMRKQQY